MSSEDPFLQVQAEVLETLSQTRPLYQSYLRIRSLATSATSPELTAARSELSSTLESLTLDLTDLVATIRAIEDDPYRFGLEIDEVERRRNLVREVGDEVENMRRELERKIEAAHHTGRDSTSLPHPAEFDSLHSPTNDMDRDDYAEWEQQRQEEMMHEQDEQLDDVFRTVGSLRQQADVMGRELEEQAGMLAEVDHLAERVGGKLQDGMRRVTHVMKQNEDTMSSCCIAVLIFVLIILLILVIVL